MSASENLDLVCSIYAAWERGDWSTPEWADPEIEFVVADGFSPGVWTGVTSMSERRRDLQDVWQDFRMEAVEYRELDEERVLVFFIGSGRGTTSGLDVERLQTQGATLFHIRDGRVTRLVLYFERASALVDLGLKE